MAFLYSKFSASFSIRCLLSILLIYFGFKESVYGQRVYADVQQKSTGLLGGSITNENYPVDNNYNNFSTLNVGVGALGLMFTTQNLQFSGITNPKPKSTSPIMLKFGGTSSLLGLVDGFSIQRTNNIGLSSPSPNNVAGPEYSGAMLLDLLTLLGNGAPTEVILPIPASTTAFDGVRLRISTLLGAGLKANLYYAFYITPPTLTQATITLCANTVGTVNISNFQSGYTYRLYTAEIGGIEVGQATLTNIFTIPANLSAGDYWLEAKENDLYPSARTKITLVRNPIPTITLIPSIAICQKQTVAALAYTAITNDPNQYSVIWSGAPSGFENITNAALSANQINLSIPFNVAVGNYTGTLKVKNNTTGCESAGYLFTIIVHEKPVAPELHILTDSQY